MLVAIALVIFVMLLLTQAFVAGLGVFQELKAVGDMEDRLRMAATLLKRDLAADHWEGRKRLSDPTFFVQGPPQNGFLRIWQGSAATLEGNDGDGLPSYVATDHLLHMMVKLRGNNRQDYFFADISGDTTPSPLNYSGATAGASDTRYQTTGTYACQIAEVAYFLRPMGDFANGTALYTLYRRQRLAVPDNTNLNWSSPVLNSWLTAYSEISCKPNPLKPNPTSGNIYFNNPTDLTVPQRRFGMVSASAGTTGNGGIPVRTIDNRYPIMADPIPSPAVPGFDILPGAPGADILLTDVISFEIKILDRTTGNFVDVPYSLVNPLFNGTSGTQRVFDTWSSVKDDVYDYSTWNDPTAADQTTRLPRADVIPAIKITLRIWDKKSQRTRQVTILQDM
jgi:hypothetical protein